VIGEVLHVARDESEAVLQGRGCDLAIGHIEPRPASCRCPSKAPHRSAMDRVSGRMRAGKQDRQIRLKPQFELRSPLSWRAQGDPSTQLAENSRRS